MRHNLGWLPSALAALVLVGVSLWCVDALPSRGAGSSHAERSSDDPTAPRELALRVLDAAGSPVVGASVLVWDDADALARQPAGGRQVARTDASGRCRTEALALDAVVAVSHAEAGGSGWTFVREHPSAARMDTEVSLAVPWICDGRVVWRDETAASDVALDVDAVAREGPWRPRVLGQRRTDSQGRFAISVERARRVQFSARFLEVRSQVETIDEPAAHRVSQERSLVLHLDAGREIRGRVLLPGGGAAGGVTVFVDHDATTTAADGTFSFPLEIGRSGAIPIVASPSGVFFVAGTTLGEPLALVQREPLVLDVHPADRRFDVTLQLAATVSLEGRIESRCADVDEGDLCVWAEPSESEVVRRAGLVAPHVEGFTDEGGRFRLEGIHPDVAYDLFVRERRMMPYLVVGRGVRADGGLPVLRIAPYANLPAVVRGEIRDACNPSRVVLGAHITLHVFTSSGLVPSSDARVPVGSRGAPLRASEVRLEERTASGGSFLIDLDAFGVSHTFRERISIDFEAPGYEPVFLGPVEPFDLREPILVAMRPEAALELALAEGPSASLTDASLFGEVSVIGRTVSSFGGPRTVAVQRLDGADVRTIDVPGVRVECLAVWRGKEFAGAVAPVDDGCDGVVRIDVPVGPLRDVEVWLRPVDRIGDAIVDVTLRLEGAGRALDVPIAADGVGWAHIPAGLYMWRVAGHASSIVVPPEGGLLVLDEP